MTRWALLAAFLVSASSLCAQMESDSPALAPMCLGCHGPNGVSVSPDFPSLAGQNEPYLIKRLIEMKTLPTPSETMRGVTHSIPEEDLKRLAGFFARQTYIRNGQPVDKEKVTRGRTVYLRVCSQCHTEEGRGAIYGDYPFLAGQSLNYMLNELDHILSHKREVESIKIGILAAIPREQIEDAIHFFAGQPVGSEEVKTSIIEPARKSRRSRKK